MSTNDVRTGTSTEVPGPATFDMKLEVLNLPVSDVDRARRVPLEIEAHGLA
jgi:hypothetical protein